MAVRPCLLQHKPHIIISSTCFSDRPTTPRVPHSYHSILMAGNYHPSVAACRYTLHFVLIFKGHFTRYVSKFLLLRLLRKSFFKARVFTQPFSAKTEATYANKKRWNSVPSRILFSSPETWLSILTSGGNLQRANSIRSQKDYPSCPLCLPRRSTSYVPNLTTRIPFASDKANAKNG